MILEISVSALRFPALRAPILICKRFLIGLSPLWPRRGFICSTVGGALWVSMHCEISLRAYRREVFFLTTGAQTVLTNHTV